LCSSTNAIRVIKSRKMIWRDIQKKTNKSKILLFACHKLALGVCRQGGEVSERLCGALLQGNSCRTDSLCGTLLQGNSCRTNNLCGMLLQGNSCRTNSLCCTLLQGNSCRTNSLCGTLLQGNSCRTDSLCYTLLQGNSCRTDLSLRNSVKACVFVQVNNCIFLFIAFL
jgi:hypothetical protein